MKIAIYGASGMAIIFAGWFGFSAIHNRAYGWGMQEGWNLAVEHCSKNKENCVKMPGNGYLFQPSKSR